MAARERVIELVRAGKTSAEIAEELGISARHVARIRASAGLSEGVGRPATGQREQVSFRADDEVLVELDRQAESEGTTRGGVAGDVVAAWAQRRRNARARSEDTS